MQFNDHDDDIDDNIDIYIWSKIIIEQALLSIKCVLSIDRSMRHEVNEIIDDLNRKLSI